MKRSSKPKKRRKVFPKEERKNREFGEMDITPAFQAGFVGSSPIIRKEKQKKRFAKKRRFSEE